MADFDLATRAEVLAALGHLPLQEGVIGPGDLRVTVMSGMNVQVAAGTAVVQADVIVSGGRRVIARASSTTLTVPAAHASLPRLDQAVLRIVDPAVAPDGANVQLAVLPGTATAGVTLDGRQGAAALPDNAVRLADVLVPAAATAVASGDVRDRRPWAHGAHAMAKGTGTGTPYAVGSGSQLTIASFRVETTPGRALAIDAFAMLYAAAVPLNLYAEALVNGTSVASSGGTSRNAASDQFPLHPSTVVEAPGGPTTVAVRVGGGVGTTTNVFNGATNTPFVRAREMPPLAVN